MGSQATRRVHKFHRTGHLAGFLFDLDPLLSQGGGIRASDLVTSPMDKKAVDFIKVLGLLGRSLSLPPGVSGEALKTLRAAYDKMNADPAFAADLNKRKLRLIPAIGAKIEDVVKDAVKNATPDVVAHATKLIYGGGSGLPDLPSAIACGA